MTIFEQTLREVIASVNLVANRVYLMRSPQVASSQVIVPYVVFTPVGAITYDSQSGPSQLIQRDYQLSIFDTSQSRALAIADSYRIRLGGLPAGLVVDPYQINSCFFITQSSGWENEDEYFQVIQQYRIMHRNLARPTPYTAPLTAVNPARQEK